MSDIIVHEGKKYRKVDRPVREGDAFIVAKSDGIDITAGKVYALERADDGLAIFLDNVGDRRERGDYYVLEPVAPSISALESELAATKAKVAEMEAQLAEQRKLHEIEAKWHAIGREVGEIKKGDVVRTLKYESGHNYIGTIGIAAHNGTTASTLVTANGESWLHAVELIAPVESVVNLRGGEAV